MDRVNFIQQSRQVAAQDSCTILRELVLSATPRKRLDLAYRFLDENGLSNCVRYGQRIRHSK